MHRKRLYILSALALLTASSFAHAQSEEATAEYIETILQRFPNQTPPEVDPAAAWEGMADGVQPDDLTPGYMIIDGDIQIRIEEWEAMMNNEGGPRAVFGTVNYWGNTVPYDFAINVNATNRQAAINAMNAISALAGITFVARTSQADWIRFNASTFNNSPIGRQGGQQIINIVSWGNQIIIVHEIYHSLGFWHQQSATNRATFVTINSGNICGSSAVVGNPCNANVCQFCSDSMGNFISCAFNFDIAAGTSNWGPYDFDSIMHYGRTAFSCNGADTITVNEPWNAEWQNAIGQRDHISLIDELACRGIYPFNGDRWMRVGGFGIAGTFFAPFGAFGTAMTFTPVNGTLLMDPGTYSGVGTYSQAKTIRATYGTVTIGN